ncbi:MAG: hypothetical protein HKN76_16875 [Saprospiraceae bacterium]|nr:hypothetical protein [Saprospiraceae bacterium]
MGGSVDYNTYLTELKYAHEDFRDFKIKQHGLGSHLYIGTHIANRKNLSFSLRAYYQFVWDALNTRALRDRLDLQDDNCGACEFSPGTFGLTILLNNGPQWRR